MLRHVLDTVYKISGAAAALAIAAIAGSILVQLACRFAGVTFDATELAGFFMATATFLGLAHTFKSGGHVRITLTFDRLKGRPRRIIEVFNCLVAGSAVLFLSCYLIDLVGMSYEYHDISPGLLAVPFWIPQLMVSSGVVIFAIAILDELILILCGRRPSYDSTLSSDETPED
ncbi:TRAP transporter small permease [Thalassospira sp. HF15]|nr:TRAP transporter small permease [Thalassospira sp. HF15]NIY75328.1 TRAP transporter small permease [Thalassospira sp. HF15]